MKLRKRIMKIDVFARAQFLSEIDLDVEDFELEPEEAQAEEEEVETWL